MQWNIILDHPVVTHNCMTGNLVKNTAQTRAIIHWAIRHLIVRSCTISNSRDRGLDLNDQYLYNESWPRMFILHWTLCCYILCKEKCKPRRETFTVWDLVHYVLYEIHPHNLHILNANDPTPCSVHIWRIDLVKWKQLHMQLRVMQCLTFAWLLSIINGWERECFLD